VRGEIGGPATALGQAIRATKVAEALLIGVALFRWTSAQLRCGRLTSRDDDRPE